MIHCSPSPPSTGSSPPATNSSSKESFSVACRNLVYGGFSDNRAGVFGSDEWVTAVVSAVDERFDGVDQLPERVEGAAGDSLAGDDREEDHLRVEPRDPRSHCAGL